MTVAAVSRAGERLARLAAGIAELGLDIPDARQEALLAFVHQLAKWNGVFNLTAVHDLDDMVVLHLLDCLAVLPRVDATRARRVLDIGSGAGLPGIPIALVRPDLAVTTADAVAKKIGFQQQVKAALRIANLTPLHVRVEALALSEKPDLIISRAYTAIPDMLASIDALADDRTTVIAMKGLEPTAELAGVDASWTVAEVVPLAVPFLGARRCAVVLRRTEPGARS